MQLQERFGDLSLQLIIAVTMREVTIEVATQHNDFGGDFLPVFLEMNRYIVNSSTKLQNVLRSPITLADTEEMEFFISVVEKTTNEFLEAIAVFRGLQGVDNATTALITDFLNLYRSLPLWASFCEEEEDVEDFAERINVDLMLVLLVLKNFASSYQSEKEKQDNLSNLPASTFMN